MDTAVATARIVVVDDEAMVLDVCRRYLESAGYEVTTLDDGIAALRHLRTDPPDLVVLDLMLPGRTGMDVLREFRKGSDVPVILLTARGEEQDRVAGLELGADDYVVKPFSPKELVARVRSVLRRTAPAGTVVEYDGFVLDPVARTLTVDGRPVDLTRREFDLLAHLATHPRQVFSRTDLLRAVWESSPEWQDPSTVTVHVRRLRTKVEPDPEHPRWLVTQWGVGYRFDP
jgi:DNA-binding response OmpR family regulator